MIDLIDRSEVLYKFAEILPEADSLEWYEQAKPEEAKDLVDELYSIVLNVNRIDAQQTVDINAKFNESDFTDEELKLLKAIFKGADAVVQSTRVDNYDTFMSNTLYSLTQKLGIDDIVY